MNYLKGSAWQFLSKIRGRHQATPSPSLSKVFFSLKNMVSKLSDGKVCNLCVYMCSPLFLALSKCSFKNCMENYFNHMN